VPYGIGNGEDKGSVAVTASASVPPVGPHAHIPFHSRNAPGNGHSGHVVRKPGTWHSGLSRV